MPVVYHSISNQIDYTFNFVENNYKPLILKTLIEIFHLLTFCKGCQIDLRKIRINLVCTLLYHLEAFN